MPEAAKGNYDAGEYNNNLVRIVGSGLLSLPLEHRRFGCPLGSLRAAEGGKSGVMTIGIVSDEPVLWHEKPYVSSTYPEATEFLILKDVKGKTFLVHESQLENGLKAYVAWFCAEANSK